MWMALAVLAALEAAAPPAVELALSGTAGAPVGAGPRSLSDVAREMREGRRAAVGGFSAVETTVSREPWLIPAFTWDEEEARRQPDVVPEPPPPGEPGPYVSGYGGWYGGGWGGSPHRRPPHVSHRGPSLRPGVRSGGGSSAHGGGPRGPRSSARSFGAGAGTPHAPSRR